MYAVIMAGGVGTRFWPRSRRRRPKQLLPITGPRSMIRLTLDRLQPRIPVERVLVVTGAEQADGVREELPELPPENLLVEPEGRNTAPCIGLAATVLAARGAADEAMAVLAADHRIADEAAFREVLGACEVLLREEDHLLTLGIRPRRPETGYGYIRKGEPAGRWQQQTFHRVERFVEKPDEATARRLVADGRHLWNSGMFVWRVGRILEELKHHLPELAAGLETLRACWGTPEWEPRLKSAYGTFPKISIDYGVMERATDVVVAEVDLGWSDVGSWASLPEVRDTDAQGNVLPPRALALDAERNIVDGEGKTFVLLGVSDLIVVEADDAVLICARDRAQEVGKIPEKLRDMGLDSLT